MLVMVPLKCVNNKVFDVIHVVSQDGIPGQSNVCSKNMVNPTYVIRYSNTKVSR
jgi:hypothetical protein